MRPANGRIAAAQAARLARTRLSGVSYATKKRRVRRAAIVAQLIWRRWHIGIWQWRLKHLRWLFEHCLRCHTRSTVYQYWLTVRDLLPELSREHWERRLKGPWTRPN